MRVERIGLQVEGIRTKVYDVDAKQLLGTFESRADACKFTGMDSARIKEYITEKRIYKSKKLDKRVCFR